MWNDGVFPSWAVCFSPALGHPKWKDLHQWLQTTLISDLWFLSNKPSSYFLYDPVIEQVLLWKTDCRRLGSTRIPRLKIWMCMPSQFILPSTDNIQMSWKTFLFLLLIFSMGDKTIFLFYYYYFLFYTYWYIILCSCISHSVCFDWMRNFTSCRKYKVNLPSTRNVLLKKILHKWGNSSIASSLTKTGQTYKSTTRRCTKSPIVHSPIFQANTWSVFNYIYMVICFLFTYIYNI